MLKTPIYYCTSDSKDVRKIVPEPQNVKETFPGPSETTQFLSYWMSTWYWESQLHGIIVSCSWACSKSCSHSSEAVEHR